MLDDNYHMIYQQFDRRLKHLVSHDPKAANWTESHDSVTMASDARERSPLVAAAAPDGYHVYYIDTSNYVRESHLANNSQDWADGILSCYNVSTSSSLVVGLDIQYSLQHGSSGDFYEMSLFYGSEDGSVHQMVSEINGSTWKESYIFRGSSGSNAINIGYLNATEDDFKFVLMSIGTSTSQIELWLWSGFPTSWNHGKF